MASTGSSASGGYHLLTNDFHSRGCFNEKASVKWQVDVGHTFNIIHFVTSFASFV
jgi:hypothetical protein